MMKHLLVLLLAGFALSQMACGGQSPKNQTAPETTAETPAAKAPLAPSGEPTEMNIGDVRIVNYTNGGGRKPKETEVAVAYVENWVADTLLASSRIKFGGPLNVPMKPIKDPSEGALHYALMTMGIGDSVVVYRPIDNGIRRVLSPKYAKETMMHAHIVLVDLKDPKDIPDLQEQMKAAPGGQAPAYIPPSTPTQKKQ